MTVNRTIIIGLFTISLVLSRVGILWRLDNTDPA